MSAELAESLEVEPESLSLVAQADSVSATAAAMAAPARKVFTVLFPPGTMVSNTGPRKALGFEVTSRL
ncbi:hypothetical protein GCM10009785_24310 [Brooklawnia cerclae]